MTDEKVRLIIGGLLHDVGKVIYRQGDGRGHSLSGYEFLKEEVHISEREILDSVRYHHGQELRNAKLPESSFAYITYIADNISSAADRRTKETEDYGFEKSAPLEPVFNILNGNQQKMYYHPTFLGDNGSLNLPTLEKTSFDENFYRKVKENLKENLQYIDYSEDYVNSLLTILEGNLTYVPSSTAKSEYADISLFDHSKLTGAFNACIYDYLEEKGNKNYRDVLLKQASEFYKEKAFLLLSMDISGIQSFIYTIHSKGALRMLRAKSFYLELMMEQIIDTLLVRTQQCRANLLYSGGGHCYILLPNTSVVRESICKFDEELNAWLRKTFGIDLYVAIGYAECSANTLKNEPQGSYSEVFRQIGKELSMRKAHRYTAEQIRLLNQPFRGDHTRECKICKRMDVLNQNDECKICGRLSKLSTNILYTDFFSVSSDERSEGLPLPFGMYLHGETEKSLREQMISNPAFVRAYSKNKPFSGVRIATRLMAGNYTTGESFEELAAASEGIERIAIFRADVDNLGAAFVSGFENEQNQDRNVTISRTATLSRQLSLFFKYHINYILAHPVFTLNGRKKENRKAAIVYSGGDDLFIAGAWDDVMELAIDVRNYFKEFTEGTLSISGGIGIYSVGYPIHASALEVAELEDDSKGLPGKDAITFLPDGETHEVPFEQKKLTISDGTYSWEEFIDHVLTEKYAAIDRFFSASEDRGMSFLYRLLDLIRHQEQKINLARYVYLLARMEPDQRASVEEKERYQIFSKQMYEWIYSSKDCRELKTAINLYAYRVRKKEE